MLITACQKDVIEADVKSIETHAGMPIEDMLFINDSVGYAVGGKAYNNGIILSTSDGGDTWITDTIIRHGLWAISKNENIKFYISLLQVIYFCIFHLIYFIFTIPKKINSKNNGKIKRKIN